MASLQPVDEAVFLTDVFLCTDATPEGIAHYTLWSKRDLSHHEVCGRLCVPSCPAPKSSHLRVCSVDRPLRGWLVVQTPPSSSTLAIRRQFRRAVHPVVPRPRVRQNGAVLLSSSTGHGVFPAAHRVVRFPRPTSHIPPLQLFLVAFFQRLFLSIPEARHGSPSPSPMVM